jgi:hypothetical protein
VVVEVDVKQHSSRLADFACGWVCGDTSPG